MILEERTIVKILIIFGIVILGFSIAIPFSIKNTISEFLTPFSSELLCYKDNQSKYILTKTLDEGGCDDIDKYHDVIKFIDCDGLGTEKREACIGMMEIVKVKTDECIKGFFLGYNKTIIDEKQVELYCQILAPMNIST